LAMLDGLATLGITEQCVTPHQKVGQYLPSWERIEATLAAVERARKPTHPTLRLGAENIWGDGFIKRLASDARTRYRATAAVRVSGGGSRAAHAPRHARTAVQAADQAHGRRPRTPRALPGAVG